MNIRHLTTLVALGSVLPLAGFSQSGSSDSTTPSTTSNQTGSSTYNSSSDTNNSRPGSSGMDRTRANSSAADRNGAYSSTGDMTGSSIADVRRISQDRLDSRLTAKSLIGEKVVDQDGKDIGRVKDIGLSSVLPQDLQKTSSDNHNLSGSAMDNSSSSSMSGSSTASSDLNATVSHLDQLSSRDVNVYVSVGGFLGAGSELVSVPASQLKREGDHLKIQMSQQQIKALPEGDKATSSDDRSNPTTH